ncbi:GNAT family N-acetyltransferase [Pedococcus bigeumensis]|uniref:N-acetyltransferase n=1 Tax=Pedococcus bigeumensis TaxID=433644 RepID=A0A502D2F4_9MICO|nr:GNAT family N-acetyltransferase [Pedococcus bigeumensis]TPG19747.1 N-acetyltransferase [Pedococcus bigeumensis]
MPVTLRPMVFEDARGVGAMHHQAWVDSYGSILPDGYFTTWTVDDAAQRWEDLLAAPTPQGLTRLVADDDGEICGFVVVGPSRALAERPQPMRQTELRGLYVKAARFGTGLGQQLLDAVLAREESAELWVFRDSPRARAFYQRNGFSPDGATCTEERFPDLLEIRMVR